MVVELRVKNCSTIQPNQILLAMSQISAAIGGTMWIRLRPSGTINAENKKNTKRTPQSKELNYSRIIGFVLRIYGVKVPT